LAGEHRSDRQCEKIVHSCEWTSLWLGAGGPPGGRRDSVAAQHKSGVTAPDGRTMVARPRVHRALHRDATACGPRAGPKTAQAMPLATVTWRSRNAHGFAIRQVEAVK